MTLVLGIESSCDETGVALLCDKRGVLAERLKSQSVHSQYGGIVPEAASREHVRDLPRLTKQCLADAAVNASDITLVAYAAGPGLLGALMAGAFFARSLATVWQIPAIGIHHMEGHVLTPLLETRIDEPFVALLVSGGHSQLVDVKRIGQYKLLGETRDDAVGEVFDKVAVMLGLGYPGGAALARLAQRGRADAYHFTRPMSKDNTLDMSFSGLKTQVRYLVRDLCADEQVLSNQQKADIAASFEQAAIDVLVRKCTQALKKTKHNTLVIAGGVSANLRLRTALNQQSQINGWRLLFPELHLCGDNGVMIAYAGLLRYQAGKRDNADISLHPRWPLQDVRY